MPMPFRVVCPRNPDHDNFSVTAHISELWRVDRDANFIEVIESGMDTVHKPDSGDSYECIECGQPAIVQSVAVL